MGQKKTLLIYWKATRTTIPVRDFIKKYGLPTFKRILNQWLDQPLKRPFSLLQVITEYQYASCPGEFDLIWNTGIILDGREENNYESEILHN